MAKPNILLTVAAILFFGAGVSLLFAPEEISCLAGGPPSIAVQVLLQLVGSALFGFALLDWTARYSRTDGIFGRPLVLANLGHTSSAALLLGRYAIRDSVTTPLVAAAALYSVLALAFGYQLFSGRPPAAPQRSQVSPSHQRG